MRQKLVLKPAQLEDIASEMLEGHDCYIHIASCEYFFLPNLQQMPKADLNDYKSERNRLKGMEEFHFKIEQPNAKKSFQMMRDFSNSLDDKNQNKIQLLESLKNKKPFALFRGVLAKCSNQTKDEWDEFRVGFLSKYVAEELENLQA